MGWREGGILNMHIFAGYKVVMSTRDRRSFIVSLFCLLLSALISPPAWGDDMTWDKRVRHGTLPNGFSYYLYDSGKTDEPFNIRLIVNAGSVDEDKPSGVAHILEHMVFQSTKAHPETLHRYFQQIGWRTGVQVNAVTRETETQYMIRTRPEDALDIEGALTLVADMAFGAQLLDADWQKERSVILQELGQGNSVADRVNRQKKELLRIGSRYVDRPTIGTEETIKATTIEDIQAFYQRFYVASNMSLVVSGRIDQSAAEAAIVRLFGSAPKKMPPDRSYVILPLDNELKVGLVQDAQGSTSQVTYAFRTEMPARATTEGQFAYLQKYLLWKLIRDRVQALAPHYAKSAGSLGFVAQETTEQRLILAFNARSTQHDVSLDALMEVIERLRREGLAPDAVQREIAAARKINENNIEAASGRTFAEWEDKITSAILMGAVLESPQERSFRTRELLDRMTIDTLNQTLRQMLRASDQVVLFQAGGNADVQLPQVEDVMSRRETLSKLATLPALAALQDAPKERAEASLPAWPQDAQLSSDGRIVSEKIADNLDISEWTLSNGDKVVWLARNNADGKIYLSGQSHPGFQNAEFGSATSQVGVQLWTQSGYRFWSQDDYDRWRKAQPASWSFELKAGSLDAGIAVLPKHLPEMLNAYASTVAFGLVREDALDALGLRKSESVPGSEPDDYAQLLYGEDHAISAVEELKDIKQQQLEDAARHLLAQPVTWFAVGPKPGPEIRDAFGGVIGAVSRREGVTANAALQRGGTHTATVKTMSQDRAQVDISFFSDMEWTPEKAFAVSTLTPIAQQALKNELRLTLGGVYSTKFELRLDPDTNRAIGVLSFNCEPERADELKNAALRVFERMPEIVRSADIDRVRADIVFAEHSKQDDPNLWLRRMALSYRRYDDARYLQTMRGIADRLDVQTLQADAVRIFQTDNIATMIRLPRDAVVQ